MTGRRTSRRRTSRARTVSCGRALVRNPKIVGFSVAPIRANGLPSSRPSSHGAERIYAAHRKCMRQAQAALPDLDPVAFAMRADAGDGGRHYAYCQQHPDGSTSIAFSPNSFPLPDAHIDGLMAHEFGHAIDFQFSAAEIARRLGGGIPRERERRADEIASRVFGHAIEYDPAIGHVQCINCGGVTPRPRGLR